MIRRELTAEDVIITPELWARPARAHDREAGAKAFRRLADSMVDAPSEILQACADAALELCRAGSSGISFYDRAADGEGIFRWVALAGELKHRMNGSTPRFHSSGGIRIDDGAPVLMRRPELVYPYLDVGAPFHETLLSPLAESGSGLEAAIWVVSHDPAFGFDGEDARVIQHIAIFTAAAQQMARLVDEARAAAADRDLLFSDLEHRVKNTLQMTASLLRLQRAGIADLAAREAIEVAGRRVDAMVHRIGAAAAADLAAVVRSVCADLIGEDDPRCCVRVEAAEDVTMPSHKAALVALIVNELVTNAVKHAFRDGPGTIVVGLHLDEAGRVVLSITDDGLPLPDLAKGGLGLKLVHALAGQLGGELTIDRATKRFVVAFPASSAHSH